MKASNRREARDLAKSFGLTDDVLASIERNEFFAKLTLEHLSKNGADKKEMVSAVIFYNIIYQNTKVARKFLDDYLAIHPLSYIGR